MPWGRVACIPASVEFLGEFRHRMIRGDRLVQRTVVSGSGLDDVQADLLQPAVLEFQDLRGAIRQIDNPPSYDRATIVYLNHDRPSVAQVGDPHIASQGKGWMSGGHVVHIVVFAAGRGFSVEILPIPRRSSDLKRLGFGRFAGFGFRDSASLSGTGLRVVWALSRSQADDQ